MGIAELINNHKELENSVKGIICILQDTYLLDEEKIEAIKELTFTLPQIDD